MANTVELNFKDLARITGRLDGLNAVEEKIATKAMQTTLLLVQRSAKVKVANGHSVTGRLMNSISKRIVAEGTGITGEVYTNVEYAPYLEYGTGTRGQESYTPPVDTDLTFSEDWVGHPAYPYMRPALEENKDKIKELFNGTITEAMK